MHGLANKIIVSCMILVLIVGTFLVAGTNYVTADSAAGEEDKGVVKDSKNLGMAGDVTTLQEFHTATNGIKTLELLETGEYSLLTGTNHAFPDTRILFPVGTGFNTVRIITDSDCTDYVASEELFSLLSTCTVQHIGPGNVTAIGSTGFKTTWDVTSPDNIQIEQTVNLHGNNAADTSFEVSMKVMNDNPGEVGVAIRYLWDLGIGDSMVSSVLGFDDGPSFTPRNPDGVTTVSEADFPNTGFEFFTFQDNDLPNGPLLVEHGTVSGPASITPPPTTPDRIVYASWPDAVSFSFDYTPSGLVIDQDSSVLYYFNDFVLQQGEMVNVSASIFQMVPPEVDIHIKKFEDLDGDGIQDANERGLAG